MRFRRRARATLLSAACLATASCGTPPPPLEPPASAAPAPVESASPVATVAPSAPPAASAPPFVAEQVRLEEGAMGTRIVMQAYTTPSLDEPAVRRALDAGLAEIRRLEGLMTTWREDSEVSRINAAAGQAPVPVGPDTFAVLEKSVWIAGRSEGTFDITFEAMKGIWRFDEDKSEALPTERVIDAARKKIDWRKLQLDPAARTARLAARGMRINLGGIAKGYAVDRAAQVLEAAGLRAYFVQAGGDLFVRGKKPDGAPFRVGVRDPRGRGELDYFAMIEVEDHAFSTAGDYERFFLKDGKRYHHIIDPRTGWPAQACRSVTIWAPDAFLADAIDDAVFILGPEKGLALVESLDGVGAVIVDQQNQVHVSKRLAGKVWVGRRPTEGP